MHLSSIVVIIIYLSYTCIIEYAGIIFQGYIFEGTQAHHVHACMHSFLYIAIYIGQYVTVHDTYMHADPIKSIKI